MFFILYVGHLEQNGILNYVPPVLRPIFPLFCSNSDPYILPTRELSPL